MINIQGKTALVTGASRGIGQQIAIGLAKVGADVIIHASRLENLAETESMLLAYDVKVYKIAGNLGDTTSVQEMLATLDGTCSRVDIVYNNAAISCEPQSVYELDRKVMDKIMEINVYSLITICNHYLPKMEANGFGRIINFTSGIKDQPALEPYAISKAAVDKYTEDMAVLIKDTDVLMNTLTPGWVRTEMGGDSANLGVEDMYPGVLVPALLKKGDAYGRRFSVPDYVGLTLDDAMTKGRKNDA